MPERATNRRPHSITIIGWIFIVVGIAALGAHLLPQTTASLKAQAQVQPGLFWIASVRVLAVLGGACLLWGFNWARWLLVLWLAYHVVLSAFHSLSETAVHGLLLGVIAYFLFRSDAKAFFRLKSIEPEG